MRIRSFNLLPPATAHLTAIASNHELEDSPSTTTVIQAVSFALKNESSPSLSYRVVAKAQENRFTNLIVWSPGAPTSGFGEPGDLWVNNQASKISICLQDYTWSDVPEDEDHSFAAVHPIFRELGLAFNGTSLQWFRRSARNKVRKELRDRLVGSLSQADIISTLWRGLEAHMSITPSSQDPPVHHEPPASSELPHKRRRVFDTIEDFIKLLRAVPTHSSSPIQAGNSANRDPGVLDAFGQSRFLVWIES